MSGHTGAIVQLTFNQSGDTIYTASVDKTIGMFDSMTGQRIKRMKGGVATRNAAPDENNRSFIVECHFPGHTSFVNSVDCAGNDKPLVVSGGDDCQIKVWDTRRRQAVTTLNNNYQVQSGHFSLLGWILILTLHMFQVTAVQFNEDPSQIVTAGIDNDIKIWDTRKNAIVTEMQVQLRDMVMLVTNIIDPMSLVRATPTPSRG